MATQRRSDWPDERGEWAGFVPLTLSPTEQREFWEAINAEPRLTTAHRELGKLMRGDASSPGAGKGESNDDDES